MAINAAAFGPQRAPSPDFGKIAAASAVKAAPSTLNYLYGGDTSDAIGAGLAALSPALGAFGKDGVKAGQALNAGIGAAGAAKGISDAASGAAMASKTGGLGTLAALWNIPQVANSIFEAFDPRYDSPSSQAFKRRIGRENDGAGLQGELVRPLVNARSTNDWRGALDTDVGGARVGDSLASILNYNLGGGWYSDTDHNWRPNPGLMGLQRLLHNAGYPGTRVENGQIVSREAKRGDVGGVGEIVMGAGTHLIPQAQRDARANTTTTYSEAGEGGGGMTPGGTQFYSGAEGWDSLLRMLSGAFGMPVNTPSVFGLTDHQTMLDPGSPESGEGGAGYRSAQTAPDPARQDLTEYMGALDDLLPEAAARVRGRDRALAEQADVNRWIAGGGGTG